jgi:hypothetical protein
MKSLRRAATGRRSFRASAVVVAVAAMAVVAASPAPAGASGQPPFALVHTHAGDVAVTVHRRSGILPTLEAFGGQTAAPSANLQYGGGTNGIGVTTGPPKVYVVYWGSQWGTETTGTDGYKHYSGDPQGLAPDQQAFFTGVGTGSETWSGVPTQYCEGVATGSQTCPSSAAHVGYPTGGSLAGVWEDTSAAAPSNATQTQIAAEAKLAADHFGNTTADSNRNAQYVITSPQGTHPDGFPNTGFCAWHDWASTADGPLPYTNMPYVTDAGTSCGQNFVNSGSAGLLDGVTIVGGHEYAETITDQLPPLTVGSGGWLDSSGFENADKCAWRTGTQEGAAQDITLTTGMFAVQSTWANDDHSGAGGCEVFHPIVTGSPDYTISASPTSVTVAPGASGQATITTAALNGYSGAITLSVAGLAAGASATFSPNPIPAPGAGTSTMTLSSGTASPGTYPLTVTGSDGTLSHTTPVSFTISSGGGTQLLGNPGFENGSSNPAPWAISGGVINSAGAEPPNSGSWDAWLGGHGTTHTDTLYQQVSIPAGVPSATLTLFLHVDTADATGVAHDAMRAQVRSTSNTVLQGLASYSNLNAAAGYAQKTFDLTSYAGQTIRVYFQASENASLQTSFVLDDVALTTGSPSGSQLLGNPGFENGSSNPAPWVISGGVINSAGAEPPNSGSWDAWLGGHGTTHQDTMYQDVAIPVGVSSATLTLFLHIDTAETGSSALDTMRIQVRDTSNSVLKNLATYSNLNAAAGYAQKTFDLTSFAGQTIRVFLLARENASLQTSFVVDDFALDTP